MAGEDNPSPSNPPAQPDPCQGPITALAQVCDANGDVISYHTSRLRDLVGATEGDLRTSLLAEIDEIMSAVQSDDAIREQFVGPRPPMASAPQRIPSISYLPYGARGSLAEGANPH